jgi:hypothetical protein
MEALDRSLEVLEFVLVVLSIVWLIQAVRHPLPRRIRRAGILALVTALTVAQPFGVAAHSQPDLPPATAHPVDPQSPHVVSLFGIPALPFVLYNRDNVWPGENAPTATLRARSWMWGPILTNATKVTEACANSVFSPCWRPEDAHSADPGTRAQAKSLSLLKSGDKFWITMRIGAGPGDVSQTLVWRLSGGAVSIAGMLYWLGALALFGWAVWRSRRTHGEPL